MLPRHTFVGCPIFSSKSLQSRRPSFQATSHPGHRSPNPPVGKAPWTQFSALWATSLVRIQATTQDKTLDDASFLPFFRTLFFCIFSFRWQKSIFRRAQDECMPVHGGHLEHITRWLPRGFWSTRIGALAHSLHLSESRKYVYMYTYIHLHLYSSTHSTPVHFFTLSSFRLNQSKCVTSTKVWRYPGHPTAEQSTHYDRARAVFSSHSCHFLSVFFGGRNPDPVT